MPLSQKVGGCSNFDIDHPTDSRRPTNHVVIVLMKATKVGVRSNFP